jgi:hypothetical protein
LLRPTGQAHRNFVPGFIVSLFAIFALLVMLLPGGAFDGIAQAQSSPSPSGPQIELMNPSRDPHSNVLSDKPEQGTATPGYHLNAWAVNLPSSPLVEFEIQPSSGQPITIGAATQVGPDTFERYWQIPDGLADGSYTLRAILYSNNGAQEADRDEEAVTINQTGDVSETAPDSEAAETAEITYPTNAGPLGFNKGVAIIDVVVSTAQTGPSPASSQQTPGTDEVRVLYSISRVGTEPAWKQCGQETVANSTDGVRCTLASGDNPSQVTAVAADAIDKEVTRVGPVNSPADTTTNLPDSGDAHRVLAPYVQVATTVTVTPATQQVDLPAPPAAQAFPCSQLISAVVLDQSGRKIPGHNVDVHAVGPSDQLQFDSSTGSDASQAPNLSHSGSEPAYNCSTNAQSGTQGEHAVANASDIKHVESAAQGTRDDGSFRFRLHTDVGGTTQITVYADRDDNDLRCVDEPAGNASIGWGTTAPTPSGSSPEQTPCPAPTGSPTASPTGSPTASRSATPTGSPTPGTSRTVTLAASDAKVEAGDEVTLNGQIVSSNSSCEDGEFVRIRRRVHGTDTFADFGSATSDAEGLYETTITASVNADYVAVAPAHDNCAEATSQSVTVLAKVKVSIKVNDFTPEKGTEVVIKGKVTPNHRGTKVTLQRKKGGRWVKVAKDELNRRSRYRFEIDADWAKDRRFRVRWMEADSDHETGISQAVKVVTHN